MICGRVENDTSVRLPRELVKKLKYLSIEEDKSIKQLLIEIIEADLSRREAESG